MRIHFQDGAITLDAPESILLSGSAEYKKNAIDFCLEWMSGKEWFSLSTSGSTGVPKPILISRKQMQASAAMTAQALRLKAADKALICLNTDFIAGKMMLVRCMEIGMEMTVVPPSSYPFHGIEDMFFDFTAMVPMQVQHSLEAHPESLEKFNAMKAILIGGASIGLGLEAMLDSIQTPVYSTYGMTETVSHIALRRLNGIEPAEIYKVLPGVTISQDERGCLMVLSEVTDNKTVVTNDLVEIRDPIHFRWLGRIDLVINSGGIKVFPEVLEATIEKTLAALDVRRRFFICGLPHPLLGEEVCLVLEGDAFEPSEGDNILKYLNTVLEKYLVPKKILNIAHFIETGSGKVDRMRNKELL